RSASRVERRTSRERPLLAVRVFDERLPTALADAGKVRDRVITAEDTAFEGDVVDVDPVVQADEASQVRGKTPLLPRRADEVDPTARRSAPRVRIVAVIVAQR